MLFNIISVLSRAKLTIFDLSQERGYGTTTTC